MTGRYAVVVRPRARKQFDALEQPARQRVGAAIDALAHNPRPPGVTKLEGDDDLWRVRAGDYRVVYTIDDDVLVVTVVRVGHRRDVYRR